MLGAAWTDLRFEGVIGSLDPKKPQSATAAHGKTRKNQENASPQRTASRVTRCICAPRCSSA
jgi:hypothetical protein